jgi:HEAT repeat protein
MPRMPRVPRVSAPVEPQPAPATAGLHVAILAALADPSVEIREDALRKVGQLRDPNHVESVAHMLYDPEPNVRKALLHALAKMRSPEAEVVVAQLLYDDDDEVVRDALLAASAGGYADALPQIRQIAGEDDLDLAVKAARALRRLGDDGAADAVIDRFVDALDEPGPMQRRHAVRQIGRIGGAAAIPYLSKIALRDPDLAVRREASWALENLRSSLELAE